MHQLSFLVKHPKQIDGDPMEFPADVYVRVNGIPLLQQDGNYDFDPDAACQIDAVKTAFSPFVCSCGSPKCAGIDEHVVMDVSADEVTWTFPEYPFRDTLNAKLFDPQAPLVLRFNKNNYAEALENLSQLT